MDPKQRNCTGDIGYIRNRGCKHRVLAAGLMMLDMAVAVLVKMMTMAMMMVMMVKRTMTRTTTIGRLTITMVVMVMMNLFGCGLRQDIIAS